MLVVSFAFDEFVSLDVKFQSHSYATCVIAMAVPSCDGVFPLLLCLKLRKRFLIMRLNRRIIPAFLALVHFEIPTMRRMP